MAQDYGLSSGAKVTIHDLLYGLMLCSGNDAAVALAEEIGGSIEKFAELMNKKAEQLNLKDTHFVTPHGLDKEEHYTTAYELACLTDYALKIEKFAQIVKTQNYTITINGQPKQIHNTNELLGNLSGVYGVKTGFTNGANRCVVTATRRNNMDIICVVLGADTKKYRTSDSIKLIEYAFKNYEMVNIEDIIRKNVDRWCRENKIFIIKGIDNILNIKIGDIKYKTYPLKKWETDDIYLQISCESNVNAPISYGQKIGEVIVLNNENMLFSVDLIAEKNVEKKHIIDYYIDILRNFCSYVDF